MESEHNRLVHRFTVTHKDMYYIYNVYLSNINSKTFTLISHVCSQLHELQVCYHNFMGVADYGKYGHGEVVGMKIPQSSIGDFAKEYFDLFTAKGGRYYATF